MAFLKQVRGGIAVVAVGLMLAACQTLGGSGLIVSTVTAELTTAVATSIAGDMVGKLGTHIGPGGTTIRLRGDGSAFGIALEQSLRSAGYAVVGDQHTSGTKTLELAYAVDSFEGSIMVRLSTVGIDLTRLYKLEGDMAIPTSPVSVAQHDEVGPR